MWNHLDNSHIPAIEEINSLVQNPLWEELHRHLSEEYGVSPKAEYSACSMQRGWNLKYKKGGRSLCTVYPLEGHCTVLVIIGERELAETELLLPGCCGEIRRIYDETKPGCGSRWLMIPLTSGEILRDVKRLITIRRNAGRKG